MASYERGTPGDGAFPSSTQESVLCLLNEHPEETLLLRAACEQARRCEPGDFAGSWELGAPGAGQVERSDGAGGHRGPVLAPRSPAPLRLRTHREDRHASALRAGDERRAWRLLPQAVDDFRGSSPTGRAWMVADKAPLTGGHRLLQ